VSDEGYSRNASCAQHLIPTFLLQLTDKPKGNDKIEIICFVVKFQCQFLGVGQTYLYMCLWYLLFQLNGLDAINIITKRHHLYSRTWN